MNLSSFKPAMIAHYIGIGQVAAMRISAYLKKDPELDQDLVGLKKPVSKDRVKLEDGTLSVSTNNMNGARKTEWSKEQVLAEAERCLSLWNVQSVRPVCTVLSRSEYSDT